MAGDVCITFNPGRFEIDSNLFQSDPKTVVAVLHEVIPMRVEHNYARRVFEFTALSPHFDSLIEGQSIPMYSAEVRADNERLIVKWKRVGA